MKKHRRLTLLLFCYFFLMSNVIELNAQSNVIKISGIVLDEKREPIIGVSVVVGDKGKGTITDNEGKFNLEVAQNSTVTFSFIGYKSKSLKASEIRNSSIILEESTIEMDEVVVIGYGAVRKQDLTGSVSVVKTEDFDKIPVARVDQMLQGRIAGVDVMSSTGEPGDGTSIRIRGTRSITASNDPLYVIDGIADASANIGDINPSDIESMQVLKDASATAIYGSRAANGVILITTKKGKEGRPKYSLKADFGLAELPQMLDVMNATEYALFYNDYRSMPSAIMSSNSSLNSKTGAPYITLEEMYYKDPLSLGNGTNWVDEVTRTAPYQNYILTGSGGSKATKYYFSFSYNDTRGIINNSGMKRLQGRLNLDQDLSDKVKGGVRLNFTYFDQDKNSIDIGTITSANVNAAISLPPTMPVYNEDGTYNGWNPVNGGNGGYVNSPVALAELVYNKHFISSLSSNFYLEYRPIKDLLIKSTFSYQDYSRNQERVLPSTLPMRSFRGQGAYANQQWVKNSNLQNENTVNYKKKLDKHNLDFLYGFTYTKRLSKTIAIGGNGYSSDETALWSLASIPDKNNYAISSGRNETVLLSNLARFNYHYDNRYYLTLTGRADGASNFAENNKWAFFPSVAVKWNLMNESFMKGLDRHISGTAFRFSYGITGNQGIAAYSSLSKIMPYSNGYIFNNTIPGSYYLSSIGSPDLTWEKTTSYNLGLDFGILRNRINFNLDFYTAQTRDLLLEVQMPNQTGFQTRLQNIGITSNTGYELTLNSVNIDKKNFTWSTAVTVSHNKQMVIDAGGYDRIPTYIPNSYTYEMYGYKQGYPVNALWGMEYAGTWKSREEIEEAKITKKYVSKTSTFTDPGRAKYVDQNNDGILDRNDIVYLGSSDPIIYGGIQNTFSVYGINISLYFNYSYGGYIFNPIELSMGSGDNQTNQYRYMTNAWHPVRNPDSDIPRAGSKDFVVSTAQRHDASFIRLKDVSISYVFKMPQKPNKKIDSITLSLSGNNIYLWKYYNGFDPEVSSPNGTRRIDLGAYPNSRTIIFGTQVNF